MHKTMNRQACTIHVATWNMLASFIIRFREFCTLANCATIYI